MNQDLHLKLQADFDGELPAGEARELADVLARDAEARALLAELKNTRGALKAFEADLKLPESREFYWSKIQRAIERGELAAQREPAAPVSWFTAWRRMLVPVSAVAVLVLAAFLAGPFWGPTGAPELESTVAEAGAFTYRDYANGTTLVWLSYPAENGIANPDPDDILD